MIVALALMSSLLLSPAAALQDDGKLPRSGISDKDLAKMADDVGEYFKAEDVDDRGTQLELEESLLSAFAKSGKRAKIDRHPLAYVGDWDYVLEVSKEVDRGLRSSIGKGFFKHVFEDAYGTPPVGTVLSIPGEFSKTKDLQPPAIVVLKPELGLAASELEEAVIERANALYADLLETHIILVPLGPVDGDGRRAETREATGSWLAPEAKQVFFTGLRVLTEQLRFDRSRLVLDGWGSAGAEAVQLASFAPSWFAGVISRGGELPGEDTPAGNLASMGVLLLASEGEADASGPFADLEIESVADAGAWDAPSEEALTRSVEWINAQVRDLAPKEVRFLAADRQWSADNWCNIRDLNRRVTAVPTDDDFPRVHARIDASANAVVIDAVNVGEVLLYLSDALLDLDKEIKVTANGEEKFVGVLERDLQLLLENRYYMNSQDYGVYTASVLIEDIPLKAP